MKPENNLSPRQNGQRPSVVVVGATGTGNSNLRVQFQLEIMMRRAAHVATDPGVIPSETVDHPRVGVNWTDFYRSWLTSQQLPEAKNLKTQFLARLLSRNK